LSVFSFLHFIQFFEELSFERVGNFIVLYSTVGADTSEDDLAVLGDDNIDEEK